MGTNRERKSAYRKFHDIMIKKIGMLILHSVGATAFIMITILIGVECAKSGGHWSLLLSLIVCIVVTLLMVGSVVVDTCNVMLMIEKLYNNAQKY